MNWLAFDARVYAAALCGCVAAVALTTTLDPLVGSAPWLTGLLAGLACAAAARDRSGPRGLVVAVMATWTAAIEAAVRSAGSDRSLLPAVLDLHATLGAADVAAYAVGFALAFTIARSSLRRGAAQRVAGA